MSFQSNGSVRRSTLFTNKFTHLFTPKILSFALAGLISLPSFAGFPTLYGKALLTLNSYDLEKNNFSLTAPGATSYKSLGATGVVNELDTVALESTGSRFGIQGDFGVQEGTSIFYRVEYGVDYDNGTNSNGRELTQRNIFGGLRGEWGQILAGKNDTPLKTIQTNSVLKGDIDRFNDYPLADIGTYLAGENRPDNVIQYTSPILFGGLEVNLAAIQSEETGVAVNATNPQNDNGFASGKSVSLTYGKAKWFLAAAYDSNVATADTFRALGEIILGNVKLGAIYSNAARHEKYDVIGGLTSTFVGATGTTLGAQNGINPLAEWDGASGTTAYKAQDGLVLNGSWKLSGPWVAKFQWAQVYSTPSNQDYRDVKTEAAALGVDYNLSESARLFSYIARLKTKGDEKINTHTSEDKTLAIGLDYRF